MKVEWTKKDIAVTESMAEVLERKVEKLSKFVSDDATIKLSLKRIGTEKSWFNYQFELFLPFKHSYLKGISKNNNFYEAVDEVVEKLVKQVKKENEISFKAKRKHLNRIEQSVSVIDIHEKPQFEELSRRELELKPMSEEEAVLQMNLFRHDSFLFRTIDGDVKLIKKDKYGKIELISVA